LSHIGDLIEDNTNFRVDRRDGRASFRPVRDSDADIDRFQSVVLSSRANQGDGYVIEIEEKMSDLGESD